jgi:antitoxin HicB
MKYNFQYYEEDNGYWAECLELKGCNTQAETMDELNNNIKEVLELYFDENDETEFDFAIPEREIIGKNIISVELDPTLAFPILLRHIRLKNHLTQKQAAARIGMNNIFSYQRLEKRSNPTLQIIKKVKRAFPEMSVDKIV